MWIDLPFTGGGGGAGCGFGSAYARLPSGDPIEITVTTPDGATFRVTVNGTAYSETDGTLFLVRTRGPNVEVRQVARDLSGLPADEGTWRQVAKDEPEVKQLIAEAEKKK
jgi:hypothetical protein